LYVCERLSIAIAVYMGYISKSRVYYLVTFSCIHRNQLLNDAKMHPPNKRYANQKKTPADLPSTPDALIP
jgi:hypothetical protein